MFHVPEQFRVRNGRAATTERAGNNGVFIIPAKPASIKLRVIASDGDGWEHVSVSTYKRCPTWEEMCLIKSLFWDDDDCVVQFHPPESDYVNFHPFCLHLWRRLGTNEFVQRPPAYMIGPIQ